MAVDDRMLTVGSANLTNRSLAVDTELHVTWETTEPGEGGAELVRSIRALRADLLREHAGLGEQELAELEDPRGLVGRLDALTSRPNARLCKLPPATEEEREMLEVVDADALPFDPAKPNYDLASEVEDERQALGSIFVRGMSALVERFRSNKS
jgi:phosphatidylserine/phosphatidylglycerophosphate/cardiolipin synthase-like enzyme